MAAGKGRVARWLPLALLMSAALFVASAEALYGPSSDVTSLNPGNFNKVLKSDRVVFVEFFAPWCGHCKSLVPEYEKAAKALKGIASVAALDADEHKQLASEYGVQGFPTIKMFVNGKASDYQGGRTAKDFAEAALSATKKLVKERLSGKSAGGGGSSSSGGGGGEKKKSGKGGKDAVVKLTADNFEELVLNSKDLWMIEFFAPWCGHCKKLAPEWAQASSELEGKVKLGAVDCTEEESLARKYGVKGYPTIKVFGVDKENPTDYQEGRTASSIVSFAERMAEENAAPKEVLQLTTQAQFKETCLDGTATCVIAFLPHILDSKANGRNKYIDIVKSVAAKLKSKPFNYLWVEGASQPKLEAALEVGGSGYPAIVVVKPSKNAFAPVKAAFTDAALKQFLNANIKLVPLLAESLPAIVDGEPWDGKDGKLVEEDEFDLSELMSEEL